jgi:hypothetical protein
MQRRMVIEVSYLWRWKLLSIEGCMLEEDWKGISGWMDDTIVFTMINEN